MTDREWVDPETGRQYRIHTREDSRLVFLQEFCRIPKCPEWETVAHTNGYTMVLCEPLPLSALRWFLSVI